MPGYSEAVHYILVYLGQLGKSVAVLDICDKSLKLDRVNRALARCHSLVELFHRSWLKNHDLHLKQELLKLSQHKLIASVATRWGSTYDMVSRIVEQQVGCPSSD